LPRVRGRRSAPSGREPAPRAGHPRCSPVRRHRPRQVPGARPAPRLPRISLPRIFRPMSPRFLVVAAATLILAAPLPAQQWNTPEALSLAAAGAERRQAAEADSTLTSYHTRAHGFVFFLAQVGEEGLS